MMRGRRLIAASAVAAAVTTTALGLAGPADAATQNGLVNVSLNNVHILQDVDVGVAANVLANVCGVEVNAAVIADQVVNNGQPLVGTCTARNNAPFMITS